MDHLNNNIPYFLGNWKILVLGVKLMEMNSNHCFNRHELQLWYPRMPVNLFRIPSGNCSFWRPRFGQIFKLQIFKREKATVIYTNQNPHRKKNQWTCDFLQGNGKPRPRWLEKSPWSFLQLCRPSNAATNQIVTVLGFQSGGFVWFSRARENVRLPLDLYPQKESGDWNGTKVVQDSRLAVPNGDVETGSQMSWWCFYLLMCVFSVAFCSLAL